MSKERTPPLADVRVVDLSVVDTLGGCVPCGLVNTAADVVANPHVDARQMLVAVDQSGSDRPGLTPNMPVRLQHVG